MSTSQIGQIGLTEFASNLDARLTAVEQSGGGQQLNRNCLYSVYERRI